MKMDDVVLDASEIARGLKLAASDILPLMRSGAITARLYEGHDEDAGTFACVFFHGSRRLTIIVDTDGKPVRQSSIDFGDRHVPASLRNAPPGSRADS